jgi:hypothetical protein
MPIRTTLIAALVVSAAAFAQGPGPGLGRMGRFGGEAGGPPMGGRLVGAVAGMPGRVVKSAPYSADVVTETSQTLADGNHVRQTSTARVYRDSEGRVRTEQSLGGLGALGVNSSQRQVVFINDPVAGVNYALNVEDKTASKTPWARAGRGAQQATASPRAQGQNGAPPAGGRWGQRTVQGSTGAAGRGGRAAGLARQNVKTESLGRQTIEGVAADGTRTTWTIPAGQMGNEAPILIVSERWYSAELQAVVTSRHSDPRVGETVYRLANVSRAEPAPSLFQAPADYKVTDVRGGRGPAAAPAQ